MGGVGNSVDAPVEWRTSAYEIGSVLLRHVWLIVILPAIAMAIALVLTLSTPQLFRAQSTILLQASASSPARLAGMAAQLGFSVPGQGGGDSPALYAELLTSRGIIEEAVVSEYAFDISEGRRFTGTLVEFFDPEGETPAQRAARSADHLRTFLSVRIDNQTGLIHLTTSAGFPELAGQINRRLLEVLTQFNLERRQSQAGAERQFIASRLGEAQRELRKAETELENFLSANRSYQASPQLAFEANRLQREVDRHQQVVTALNQSYDQAAIEEVRSLPVFTLVNATDDYATAVPRPFGRNLLLALLIGLLLAAATAFARESLRRQKETHPEQYRAFVEQRHKWARFLRINAALRRNP